MKPPSFCHSCIKCWQIFLTEALISKFAIKWLGLLNVPSHLKRTGATLPVPREWLRIIISCWIQIFNGRYIANVLLSVPVQEFRKSVNIWWSYKVMKFGGFLHNNYYAPPGRSTLTFCSLDATEQGCQIGCCAIFCLQNATWTWIDVNELAWNVWVYAGYKTVHNEKCIQMFSNEYKIHTAITALDSAVYPLV